MQTVPLHALSMRFYWTNARHARIPRMETGVTRNVHTTVNLVIYKMARAINVSKTTREKIVKVYFFVFLKLRC